MNLPVSKLDSIILKTSESLSLPPEQVAQVIKHLILFLNNFRSKPTHPAINISGFGRFVITKNMMYNHMKALLNAQRREPTPHRAEVINSLFKIRHQILELDRRTHRLRYKKRALASLTPEEHLTSDQKYFLNANPSF